MIYIVISNLNTGGIVTMPKKDASVNQINANNLYTNWLNYYVYQVTPYDMVGTPF